MHVSNNSYAERPARAPAPIPDPTPSGAPELPVAVTRGRDGYRGRSAQFARDVVVPTPSPPLPGSVEEADAHLLLETRYQEYLARRALDEVFANGEAENLCL